jgi:hypothetical protein
VARLGRRQPNRPVVYHPKTILVLSLTAYETAWNTTTDPRILTGIAVQTDDLIVAGYVAENVVAGTTDLVITTTAGSTGAWTEIAQAINNVGVDVPYLVAWARATAIGTIDIQCDYVGATVANNGMFVLVVHANAGGQPTVGNFSANSAAGDATPAETLTIQDAGNNAVYFLAADFSAGTVATGASPASAVVVENSQNGAAYSVYAAYWPEQATGSRSYGPTGFGGSDWRGAAVEIRVPAAGGSAPPQRVIVNQAIARAATY